ncbi:hypothetical protein GDO81_007533, partial [Engystomops pustulosus]
MNLANHGLTFLQQLNAQREFGFLCDCTVALGMFTSFKAHKSVLASFSNYFKMFFVHQTEHRKYECTICGRKFIRKSHWREHMYIH